VYRDQADFDKKTGLTYHPEILFPLLEEGYWPSFEGHPDYTGGDPYPYRHGKKLRSREGAGRLSVEDAQRWIAGGWAKLDPRMPLSYAQWAKLPGHVPSRQLQNA
jgi:hypothetical protein